MSFESELSKGVFSVPECRSCNKVIWPPVEFCNRCFGTVNLKKGEFDGNVIEFSRQNNEYFVWLNLKKIFEY